jgi:hypothetical protein
LEFRCHIELPPAGRAREISWLTYLLAFALVLLLCFLSEAGLTDAN